MDVDESIVDLFYQPENYNIVPFQNVWDGSTKPIGKFIPVNQSCDKWGNLIETCRKEMYEQMGIPPHLIGSVFDVSLAK